MANQYLDLQAFLANSFLTGGGGGGGVDNPTVTFGAYTAVPGSPATGDLHYCDDSPYVRVYDDNLGIWRDWLDGFGFVTAPRSVTWSQDVAFSVLPTAQGGAVIGGERAYDASAGNSWTCTAIFSGQVKGSTFNFSVPTLGFYDVGSRQEALAFVAGYSFGLTTTSHMNVQLNNNPTSFSTLPGNQLGLGVFKSTPWVFWRATWDHTTGRYAFSFSGDGYNWVEHYANLGWMSGTDVKPSMTLGATTLLLHWEIV